MLPPKAKDFYNHLVDNIVLKCQATAHIIPEEGFVLFVYSNATAALNYSVHHSWKEVGLAIRLGCCSWITSCLLVLKRRTQEENSMVKPKWHLDNM